MRIPLIVNASPSSFQESTKIRIRGGFWRIEHDLIDTKIDVHHLHCGKLDGDIFDVAPWGIGEIWVSKKETGTEDKINIFAVSL